VGFCTENWPSFQVLDRVETHHSGMPTLTPEQLREARMSSGRFGGRPRKPTRDEARSAAFQTVVPTRDSR
jgi:hypothetical protein